MTRFIFSALVMFMAIGALLFTIMKRKKIEFSIFLFLLAFEIIIILVAGWAFIIYGAILEMSTI